MCPLHHTHLNRIPNDVPGADGHLIPESRSKQVVGGEVGNEFDQRHGRYLLQSRLDIVRWEAAEEGHVMASADGKYIRAGIIIAGMLDTTVYRIEYKRLGSLTLLDFQSESLYPFPGRTFSIRSTGTEGAKSVLVGRLNVKGVGPAT